MERGVLRLYDHHHMAEMAHIPGGVFGKEQNRELLPFKRRKFMTEQLQRLRGLLFSLLKGVHPRTIAGTCSGQVFSKIPFEF